MVYTLSVMKSVFCSKYGLIQHRLPCTGMLSSWFWVVFSVTAKRTECLSRFIWPSVSLCPCRRMCSSELEGSASVGVVCVWRGLYFPVIRQHNTRHAHITYLHTPYCIKGKRGRVCTACVHLEADKQSSRCFRLSWEVSFRQGSAMSPEWTKQTEVLKPCNFLCSHTRTHTH